MKSISPLFKAAITIFFLSPLLAFAKPLQDNHKLPSLSPILAKVMPAVVNIKTIKKLATNSNMPVAPQNQQAVTLASGVIVNAKQGFILTNHHVIDDTDEIVVTLQDGRHFLADIVGSDEATDVAVIRINATSISAAPLGSSDKLQVGDYVLAIGNPFGLNQSVTSGIVSALGRTGLGIEGYEDFIQTDASINMGNSGGALINLKGELVGINTAIYAPDGGNIGIGFAIPIDMANQLMQQLVSFGEIRRGRLGVIAQPLNHDLAQSLQVDIEHGALIAQVSPRSIAAKAGLKIGDVVLSLNQKHVNNAADLRNEVGLIPIGKTFSVEILRHNHKKTIKLTMSDPKSSGSAAGDVNENLSGIEFGQVDKDIAGHGHVIGLELLGVSTDSIAYRSGLRKGDVIASFNRKNIESLTKLKKTLDHHSPILVRVLRRENAFFVVLKS